MRLSEIQGSENRRFFLLKFSDNKGHLEALQNGSIYMNNLKYFVDLEKETGIKGMGDLYEAANVLNDVKMSFFDHQSNEFLFDAYATKSYFRYENTLSKPVFCCFSIDNDMLFVEDINENQVKTKLVFSEDQKEKMIKEFGKYVLIIPWNEFIDRVFKAFRKNGIQAVADFVKYDDFSINSSKRLKSFTEQSLDMFFWKDKCFQYQNEFRIVVLNKDVDKNLTVVFEDINAISSIVRTEKLVNGDYGITLNGMFEKLDD